jgi:hypothetical protein
MPSNRMAESGPDASDTGISPLAEPHLTSKNLICITMPGVAELARCSGLAPRVVRPRLGWLPALSWSRLIVNVPDIAEEAHHGKWQFPVPGVL